MADSTIVADENILKYAINRDKWDSIVLQGFRIYGHFIQIVADQPMIPPGRRPYPRLFRRITSNSRNIHRSRKPETPLESDAHFQAIGPPGQSITALERPKKYFWHPRFNSEAYITERDLFQFSSNRSTYAIRYDTQQSEKRRHPSP